MAKTDKNLVNAIVAKRRSIDIDGKLYGPGAIVELAPDEAFDLLEKGFVVDPREEPAGTDEGAGGQVDQQGQ